MDKRLRIIEEMFDLVRLLPFDKHAFIPANLHFIKLNKTINTRQKKEYMSQQTKTKSITFEFNFVFSMLSLPLLEFS